MCSAHDSPPYDDMEEDAPTDIRQTSSPPSDYQDQPGGGDDTIISLDRLLTRLGKGVIVFAIAYLTLHIAYAIWLDRLP